MKWIDFALAVIEFAITLLMAHIIGLFPGCSVERTMLVFILWQLHLQRRKVVVG